MSPPLDARLQNEIEQFRRDGVYKRLNFLDSPQGPRVEMEGRGEVVILSSNNYLGLCDEPAVVEAGVEGVPRFGARARGVRFICGAFTVHPHPERAPAPLVRAPAALSFLSARDAHEG